jgi:ADP-dependent NAD(P)H-hydrate dehydratase
LVKRATSKREANKVRSRQTASEGTPLIITPKLLRRWPLPQPSAGGDKEERGRVLVIGGERETPGAVVLAAEAALRAGAGKLRIAVPRSIAQTIAAAVPEARVFALPETKSGAIAASAAERIVKHASDVQATLIGPGMINEVAAARLVKKFLLRVKRAPVILDAAALSSFKEPARNSHALNSQIVLTPNPDEMAELLGKSLATIRRNPQKIAGQVASRWRAIVALKGRETFIAAPSSSPTYCNRAGNVGLATSGSGDVLSGIIAGLAARGATPLQAAVWGVYLHARAGEELAKRMGRLGYLARELLTEVPRLMSELDKRKL